MFIDTSLLKTNKPFRFMYCSMLFSVFAGQMALVAMPYQIYHLTGSTLWVGLLSLCELVPMVCMGLLGGAFADRFDRRRMLILTTSITFLACLFLMWNASLAAPHLALLFVLAFFLSLANGLGRPAGSALIQAMVGQADFRGVGSLMSFGYSSSAIIGPALSGLLIAHFGFMNVYAINTVCFVISLIFISRISFSKKIERTAETLNTLSSIKQGLQYAWKRQELMGSYVVDIVAMVFGMPNALFPAIAQHLGGASVVGFLYAAPSVGAILISLLSGWTKKVRAYGKAVVIAAIFWGIFIIVLGLTRSLSLALIALALAGAADAVSGIFRQTLWNETIPNDFRGRLAGIEMISYMSGPALGNTEAGLVASLFGVAASVVSGGVVCIVGVAVCIKYFPKFWGYVSTQHPQE